MCLSLFATASLATPAKQKSQQLKQVNRQLAKVKRKLRQAQTRRQHLHKKMRRSALAINSLSSELTHIRQQLRQQANKIVQLEHEQQQLQQRLHQQEAHIGKQIRLAYQLGRAPWLQLLLSQQDLPAMQRQLQYFRYVSRAHQKAITEIRNTLMALDTTAHALQHQRSLQQRLLKTKAQRRQTYVRANQYQEQIIKALNQTILSKKQRLANLEANKRNLRKVLAQLRASKRHTAARQFKRQRQRLIWPVKGQHLHHFGDHIEKTSLTYNGEFIAAPAKRDVVAIHAGNVVFANWLKGFGLLLILDHGDGYMSLYAHNHSLFRKVGDTVQAGQLIARVGQTGDSLHSGVYFELRHRGKPLDPRQWCKGSA